MCSLIKDICYETNTGVLDQYYRLALNAMCQHNDKKILEYAQSLSVSKNVRDEMKRITFFVVLNMDKTLKDFVIKAQKSSNNEEETKRLMGMLSKLSAICDEYINGSFGEKEFLNQMRDVCDGTLTKRNTVQTPVNTSIVQVQVCKRKRRKKNLIEVSTN